MNQSSWMSRARSDVSELTSRDERACVNAVLVLRDEAEPDLDCDRAEQGEDAQRAERRVADAGPAAAQIIAHARAGRARNWRSARSSCRRSPTAGGRSAASGSRQPDQMCQSVWWFLTDHQLNTISAASSQWKSRVGRSQTGCSARWLGLSGASPTGICRGTPCRSCRGRRSCALISVDVAAAPRPRRTPAPRPGRRASLAAKSCGFCQISGLAPVLPMLGPGALREPVRGLRRQVRDLGGRGADDGEVGRRRVELALNRLVGLADRFHALVALVHDRLAPARR